MNTSKQLRAGALAAGIIAMPAAASAQNALKLEGILSSEKTIRPNMAYTLPGGIGGYTFVEFYEAQEGEVSTYFGKTMLNKALGKAAGAQLEFKFGSRFSPIAGAGITAKLADSENLKFTGKIMPIWGDKEGIFKGLASAGYTLSAKLPLGAKLSSFVDFALTENGRYEPRWGYGEIMIGREIARDVMLQAGVLMRSKGTFEPEYDPALILSISR